MLVSFVLPRGEPDVVRRWRSSVASLAMDLVPRITRAQAMDALSSQATVAGYKAVLLGAAQLPKLCPMLMTAAGTIPPARGRRLRRGRRGPAGDRDGARLGCVVEATDVRAAAKEQVESLGARSSTCPARRTWRTSAATRRSRARSSCAASARRSPSASPQPTS